MLVSPDRMQTNVRGLASQIKDTSASVALTADEIAQGNSKLSSRIEQQAARGTAQRDRSETHQDADQTCR